MCFAADNNNLCSYIYGIPCRLVQHEVADLSCEISDAISHPIGFAADDAEVDAKGLNHFPMGSELEAEFDQ